MNNYDVIIIGAGSVGVPLALHLAKDKEKVLVIDKNPSPGQGQNKAAIGGIRATHSEISKIKICLKSLEIFSHWEEETGDNIEWFKGGYTYPVYTERDEKTLKDLLVIQKEHNLNIDWKNPDEIREIIPEINPDGLRGGTFSPDDGSASPMLTNFSMYKKSVNYGAEYLFRERIEEIVIEKGKVKGVKTHFLDPMVVDIRPDKGSNNYYFYQHKTGQIIFCITPDPNYPGHNRESTSSFLPMVSKRLINIMPKLKNARVRRIWRGLYPMTPDGFPIVNITRRRLRYIRSTYTLQAICGR